MKDEDIDKAAREHAIQPDIWSPYDEIEIRKQSFTSGAKWAMDLNKWIPVSERLPEDMARCIIYADGWVDIATYYSDDNSFIVRDNHYSPTHWMELPKPPVA